MQTEQDVHLKKFNTFGANIKAKKLARITSSSQLQQLLSDLKPEPEKVLVLGGGSNILFTRDIEDELVLKMEIKGVDLLKEDDKHAWVAAGAGESWHDFVLKTIEMNLQGVENLSLIPGTVGAAPIQNIGAYGVEIKETFDSLEAVEIATGKKRVFSAEECEFGYRHSVFKEKLKKQFVITHVHFKLNKSHSFNTTYGALQQTLEEMRVDKPNLRSVSDAVVHIRQSKLPDPAQIGNCGSFFKNPIVANSEYERLKSEYPEVPGYPVDDEHTKLAAGWLIEHAGLKGFRKGNVGTHSKQALVLVNHGNASGAEAWELAQLIQQKVKEKFGIEIVPEVNIY